MSGYCRFLREVWRQFVAHEVVDCIAHLVGAILIAILLPVGLLLGLTLALALIVVVGFSAAAVVDWRTHSAFFWIGIPFAAILAIAVIILVIAAGIGAIYLVGFGFWWVLCSPESCLYAPCVKASQVIAEEAKLLSVVVDYPTLTLGAPMSTDTPH